MSNCWPLRRPYSGTAKVQRRHSFPLRLNLGEGDGGPGPTCRPPGVPVELVIRLRGDRETLFPKRHDVLYSSALPFGKLSAISSASGSGEADRLAEHCVVITSVKPALAKSFIL